MRKHFYLIGSAALLIAAAACSDSTGVKGSISQADANQLAADMDNVSTLGTSDFGLGASFDVTVDQSGSTGSAAVTAPFPINTSFTVTRQCPRGGQVTMAGNVVGTADRTTHSLTVDANATRTDANCAFDTRDGVLTVNGNPNLNFTSHVNIVNAVPTGLQTQTHKGSFTWARTGGSGTCDVDITSSYDPSTHTLTITGSFCGHQINVTKTRGS
jgi:hypothetical protein